MNPLVKWSAISIFYNQNEWHILINEFIKPSLKKLLDDQVIETYALFLDRDKGAHIKVILKPTSSDFNDEIFTGKLGIFLESRPSETVFLEFPLTSLFLDFENNSFYRDWYTADKLQKESLMLPVKGWIQHEISKAIANVAEADDLSMATIYTFIVYMQLGILRASFPALADALQEVKKLAHTFPGRFEDDDEIEDNTLEYERGFNLLFEHNADLLDEIVFEIWFADTAKSLPWLFEWQNACQEIAAQMRFNEQYFIIASVIFKQVGLPSNAILTNATLKLIDKALTRSLSRIIKSKQLL